MKQKLGLCCALVHDPDLLLLDEPTTGVDPLSRRQFWALVDQVRDRRPGMSLLISTAYLEEAMRFDRVVAMDAGAVLAVDSPAALIARTGASSLDEAFVALLPAARRGRHLPFSITPRRAAPAAQPAIVARGLTRRFGEFTAVDTIDLSVERGEIFGFLGSNGCGKTTTMKMLTGLLPASAGEARLFGCLVDGRDPEARRRVGYMSQSFSLYGELTVRQNLDLHARLFQLPRAAAAARIVRLVEQFGLDSHRDTPASALPLGVRQRLSLAVAVLHEPEVLILDEPTSGVDPMARDRFWELLAELARGQGTTVFVSTHFMHEAVRCDRVALMHAGRILATGRPADLVAERHALSLDDAFVAYLQDADVAGAAEPDRGPPHVDTTGPPASGSGASRMLAYAWRETLGLWRDPVRLGFSLIGTAFLMLVFGFGITMDVERLAFAALDRDDTPESRAYLQAFAASPYFTEHRAIQSDGSLERRMRSGEIQLALEIPPGFGRDMARGRPTEVAAWIDGAMPFRAETIQGYVEGVHRGLMVELAIGRAGTAPPPYALVETRLRYNQEFKSVYAMVPGVIALLLIFTPSILSALGVVREKELGSITNFYVTPVRRLEFLLGKQGPYVVLAMLNYAGLVAAALLVFDVPLKGSFVALTLGALLYVIATTGIGLLVSAFTRTQLAALFGTAIVTMMPATQLSGLMVPTSALSGPGAVIGALFPTTYFLQVCLGAFTKSLSFLDLLPTLSVLGLFGPGLILLAVMALAKQER